MTQFTPTQTTTHGTSHGGSQSTTHTQYEEQTITEGEAFSSGESWGTATAVDSAHAANLTFSYKVRNTGTEYAREIKHLAFNLYIGDDPNPACTYFLGSTQCGVAAGDAVQFANLMPNEEHSFTSAPIPLSLDQMKAIEIDPACEQARALGLFPVYDANDPATRCPGSPIRIVIEDYTYGNDEIFYEDAANGGVLIALEDGTADDDENIDTYLIPTWDSTETVLDVLARYFPHNTDAQGNVIEIWTPEYRSDTPAWCDQPKRPMDYPNRAVWCRHALSTADWWNVYTDGLGDGSEGFQDTLAAPGGVALFRFNQDSDLDGYSDRSERRLGSDPNDAASFPRPEVLAGLHSIRSGDKVTATLSLLNTGLYDAYGVEAVMVAPDDSVSITNNTVGGSGRVRAQKQVIVGSRTILQQLTGTPWVGNGHAVPAVGGYYTGGADRTYTFVVNCAATDCTVGSGTWTLNWIDGQGGSGSLNFGAGYKSPTFVAMGNLGLTVALYSGAVRHGESFTVAANTPRDTFQYTVNREPHGEPLVIVSYNDPQGNHRFIIPSEAMSLTAPTADLKQFAGDMLPDVGVEIVTDAPFDATRNSQFATHLLVNNPSDKTLTDAHLFLEFINISGTVVAEVPTQVTLPPGPTSTAVAFNSNSFSPPYNASEDYIVLAFLTDYEGNILDTAGRPLSSFQADPRPALVTTNGTITWNFGTVTQGALLKHVIPLANTGFGRLYAYANPSTGVQVRSSATIGAADVFPLELTLRTAALPTGGYDQTVYIATSDPDNPEVRVRVQGTISAGSGDALGGDLIARPLDVPITVTGGHSQGEWVEFVHSLGPDSQTLHPVKVWSQDYSTVHGVGKYATQFGSGTASFDMFGDGRDGVMPGSGNLDYAKGFGIGIINGNAGSTIATVADRHAVGRINPGDVVLIHQSRGGGAGQWELNKAVSDFNGDGTYTLQQPLKYTYVTTGGVERAQIVRVPQYTDCPVTGTVTPLAPWNGDWGGIFAVMCSGKLTLSGSISATGFGYQGGPRQTCRAEQGRQGEGIAGPGVKSRFPNSGGGGGGPGSVDGGAGAGGGSHASAGGDAKDPFYSDPGLGSQTILGTPDLRILSFGGGGGAGGTDDSAWECTNQFGGKGGNGGGILIIHASDILGSGTVLSNGQNGEDHEAKPDSEHGGGGGGAGGSIKIVVRNFESQNLSVTTGGGTGGKAKDGYAGNGGVGRIRVEHCETFASSTNPPASTQKLDCYIVEQIESTPYTSGRLNLPAAVSGSTTYNVQYGRKLDFGAAGQQVTTLRVPAGIVGQATIDALVSGVGTGSFTLKLDIGNDGEWDCIKTQTVDNAATLNCPDLAGGFNAYWAEQGGAETGSLDVPVKVEVSKPGQVLLTNLQFFRAASRLRQVQLTARNYTKFLLDLSVGDNGPTVAALDVGDDGSIDWSTDAANAAPARWTTGDLSGALNAYLNGKSGTVAVPIRVYVAPNGAVVLNDYTAEAAAQIDLTVNSVSVGAAVAAANAQYNEGDIVPVQATLRNTSNVASGPVSAAFFAYAKGWGDWYIGSAYVANIPANGSAQVSTAWNTTGFSGTLPVSAVVNPYGRTPETNANNNRKSASATVNPPPKFDQTITFGSLAGKTLGAAPFALSASASSGLPVSFSSLTATKCTVAGNIVTLVAAGLCTIRASQAGDATYNPAPPVERSFTINSPTQPVTQTISLPLYLLEYCLIDSPVVLTATASSGLPVQFGSETPAVCTVNGSLADLVSTGSCTIRADQPGDANYQAAPSAYINFLVNSCTIWLTQTITFSQPANRTYGDLPVPLSATASSGLPVDFTSLTQSVCTVSGNVATILAAGQCAIRAEQTGSVEYLPAEPVERSFTISKAAQTISFATLADRTYSEQPFTITASASSGLPVSFSSLTTAVCTVSGGNVSLVGVGNCSIRASQSGNANFNSAPAVDRSFIVSAQSQTVDFAPLNDRLVDDPPISLSATASSGLPVSFAAEPEAVCTVEGVTVTFHATGICTITATQSGDERYLPAEPVSRAFRILGDKLDQTIDFAPLPDRTFGDPSFGLSATASSGLPVSFASLTSGICTVSGNTATIIAAGECTIRAIQAGDEFYNPAPVEEQTFTVQRDSQTIAFATLADRTLDVQTFVLTATASSDLPVSFTTLTNEQCAVNGAVVALLAVGLCTVRAEQAGNDNFLTADPILRSFNIGASVTPTGTITQTITFAALSDRQLADGPVTLNATTSSDLPVTFTADPATVCTVADITVTLHATGICTITAFQPGNEQYKAAKPVAQAFRVLKGKPSQTIDFPKPADRTYGDSPFELSAAASSGLPVSFTSLTSAVCTIAGDVVTLLAAGQCTVRAEQPGDVNYLPADAVAQNITIHKATQTIAFASLPNHSLGNSPFIITASASSGLPVSFQASPTTVCSVSGDEITLHSEGECSVTATQSGNANFNAATAVTRSFHVSGQPLELPDQIYLPLIGR